MKYYVIAGEASGDLHGANLLRELKQIDPQAEFRLWGGDKMKEATQTELVKHYSTYDYMGIVEVVKHAKTITHNLRHCKQDIAEYAPDAIVFIDFPGFNLRIAPYAKSLGIRTFFYISPTVWAWKESRVKTIKATIDHMFVELPFVKTFYESRHAYKVDFVGHPLLDAIAAYTPTYSLEDFITHHELPPKPIIAVIPGSREYEIRENLTLMQEFSETYSEYQFVVAGMSRFSLEFYKSFITTSNISVVFDSTYDLLSVAHASITVCGSATLETALFNVPQVIVYRTNPITFYLGKLLVRLSYLGLPNIIMNKEIVPELLQSDVSAASLDAALTKVVHDSAYRTNIAKSYSELRNELGNEGAAVRTAKLIYSYMRAQTKKNIPL